MARPPSREARGHFRVTFHHYFDPKTATRYRVVDKNKTQHSTLDSEKFQLDLGQFC